ncbi:N-acetyltransferase [Pseudonocardia sulfidoxydans NBRC 16205]|uniref:N-acetyltransferase n=1 Tax=Pseudonocardia sulfidoxydans NBRC 16205 TaxID=1223511 RepID=A0A511DDP0_9PSEU|nr:N-acetyltransferase [Pseudonocardia sulfidoxydans NBRC 16205]
MLIRPETPADHDAVRAVHLAAFAPPDGSPAIEAALTDRLRGGAWYLPKFSLVAVVSGDGRDSDHRHSQVVGHVICTRAHVGETEALGLGPIGVLPGAQGNGIGSALVTAAVDAARTRGERLVGLLGDPNFYGRFGFVDARTVGIEAPDPAWGVHFQVLALDDDAPWGAFRYATPFDDL